jgi:hypothetical protein
MAAYEERLLPSEHLLAREIIRKRRAKYEE